MVWSVRRGRAELLELLLELLAGSWAAVRRGELAPLARGQRVEQPLDVRAAARSAASRGRAGRAAGPPRAGPRRAARRAARPAARSRRAGARRTGSSRRRAGRGCRCRAGSGRGTSCSARTSRGPRASSGGSLCHSMQSGAAVSDARRMCAVVVQHVDAERLPEEVVPDRLHAREAALARDGRRVRGRRRGRLRARVVLDRALAVVDRLEELAQRLRERRRARRRACAARRSPGGPRGTARVPTSPASPSERTAGRLASANGPEAREEGVEVGRGALEVGQQRGLLVRELAEPRHRRAQLVEELGEALEAARAARCGAWPRSRPRRPPRAPSARRRACCFSSSWHDRVRVGDEVLDDLVLVAEDAQHPRGLAQARVRAPQHLLEVVRAPGEAGAELGDDQPEALAVGAAHDVVDDVRRDRRGGLLDRDRAAVREPLVRLAGLAVHVVLADQRLRAGSRSSRPCGSRRSRAS